MKLPRPLLIALGLALSACTGTPEGSVPVRLVVLESPQNAPADLRVIDPGDVSGGLKEGPPLAAGQGAIGVQTLAGVNRLAVVYPDHVDVVQVTDNGSPDGSGLDLQKLSTLPTPQRTSDGATLKPCYSSVRGDDSRTLLVLLSACAGQAQQVVVLNTSSTDPTASWWRDLPAPYQDPAQTFVAVNGGSVTVARPNPAAGFDVFRDARNDTPGLTLPLRYNVPTTLIRDLANYKGLVYAATDAGVFPVNDGALGAAFLTPRANHLFSDGDLLASWNDTPQLIFARNSQNNAANPLYAYDVRGMAAPPDGYAYVLSGTGITRYDVLVGLSSPNNPNQFNPFTLYLPTPLVNPQDIAAVVLP